MNTVSLHFKETESKAGRDYVLSESKLTVSGQNGFKGRFTTEFELSGLNPVSKKIRRLHPALRRGSVYLLWVATISWLFRDASFLTVWVWLFLTVFFSIPGIATVVRYALPMNFEAFAFSSGGTAFDITCYREKRTEFEKFVFDLREAIEKIDPEVPIQSPQRTPAATRPPPLS